MPIDGNAASPSVTAAHGTQTRKLLQLATGAASAVLSVPMAGMGRMAVMLTPATAFSFIYPGQCRFLFYGTGNQPASLAELNAAPFTYLIDRFTPLANDGNWSLGTYAMNPPATITRTYPCFTPFFTVLVVADSLGALQTLDIEVGLMGMTG